MHWIDWVIIIGIYIILVFVGLWARKFMKGVSDFLVAGRSMGKYLGYATGNAADVGAISIVAALEAAYKGGPKMLLFNFIGLLWGIFIGKTGFVVRRIRESRIMTLPQLFEMRYSKGVRITAGVICFLSGIINMGIFPIVAGRFFTHFAGLPQDFTLIGITLPTIPVLTAFLIAAAISFAFMGGQVSVIVTDFLQSILMAAIFIIIGICVYRAITWQTIEQAIISKNVANEFLNPMAKTGEFGYFYFIMIIIMSAFGTAAWAPGIQKITSAKSAEEARAIMLLKNLRLLSMSGVYYCGFAAFAIMAIPHLDSMGLAESVANIDSSYRTQMIAPILLSKLLPVGLMGLLFAGMMSAFISTNDSYLLTWAGILVQDIIYPLCKNTLSRKAHIWLLRSAVLFIGIFIYFFGILYKPNEAIVIFQILSGTIYIAGAGTIIIIGLYWRRGNKYGAYAALAVGALIPITNQVLLNVYPDDYTFSPTKAALLAYLFSCIAYVAVSLLTKAPHFDLNKMLNRNPGDKRF